MHIINFSIKHEENVVKIIVEEIAPSDPKHPVKFYFPDDLQKSFLDTRSLFNDRFSQSFNVENYENFNEAISFSPVLKNMKYCVVNSILNKACKPRINCITITSGSNTYSKKTWEFELSTIPHITLLWIGFINAALTLNKKIPHYFINNFNEALETENSSYEFYLKKPLLDCLPPASQNVLETLINTITAYITPFIPYQDTKDTLLKIKEYINNAPFITLLSPDKIDKILYNGIGKKLLGPQLSSLDKIQSLDNLRHRDKDELPFIVKNINHLAMRDIFSPCLKQRAPDGGQYSYSYSEWYFLLCAKLNILKDGRISISIKDNEAYLEYYSSGQLFESSFMKEIPLLLEILSLDFALEGEERIIFTESASKYLIEKGALLNKEISEIFKMRIYTHLLFKFSPNSSSALHLLPNEIKEKIILATSNLSEADAQTSYSHIMSNRG